MYKIQFDSPVHVHFIGIGGISMSGLAEILLKENFTVSGSDAKNSELTDRLQNEGAQIFIQQKASNIIDGIDVVVYTAAISKDNPELICAVEKGLPLLTRAELLGQIMNNYAQSIAVSGTHGKTTTTSMLASILLTSHQDPTISVGGMLKEIGGNIRVGNSDLFLTEACEYTNSYHSFFPKYSIILNVEEDHLDFFHNIDDIRASFHKFASNTAKDGILFINNTIEKKDIILKDLPNRVYTFGIEDDADFIADAVSFSEHGCAAFTVKKQGQTLASVSLQVPGMHNVANAVSAFALSYELGLPVEQIVSGLSAFGGTGRRFEKKGELGDILIIDDYAHHPTEIQATLQAARNYENRRIVCVFQPHTYTRTKAFWNEFAKALSHADLVILADVYAARETDTLGIHSKDLATEIEKLGTECHYFPSFEEIENYLLKKCTNKDLLITMGAGDIYKVGESLLGM